MQALIGGNLEFNLCTGHCSVGFEKGGPVYGQHPRGCTHLGYHNYDDIEDVYDLQKLVADMQSGTRLLPAVVVDTDINVYRQISTLSEYGFPCMAMMMELELSKTLVDRAEILCKMSVDADLSALKMPAMYAWPQPNGTFLPGK